ncbi:MAG TPA: radical SAM protein [Kofleriaceae bacterium]|nr:radical SAM protein [Kofleriaceae bacterium]
MSERRSRIEHFGAIVQLARPRALVFVDRARARSLGLRGGAAWDQRGTLGDRTLSAPLEAHLQLTNRCEVGCTGCYTGASPEGAPREWGLVEWKRAIDELARMGVFHLALGGGESATLPWLGEIAAHARARGMIPNLTTSGLYGLDTVLAYAPLFGQINVSLDGLGATYAKVRGVDGFARADAALAALRAIKKEIGINVVVTRHNFDELGAIFAYARARRLREVELLRLKPSGRGAAAYASLACTQAQHRALLPSILAGARRHKLRVRVDCSYVPMIAHHAPSRDLLASLAVYGCTAGDFLVAAKATGAATACSFAPPDPLRPRIDQLASHWERPDAFALNRGWRAADEPCRSCTYHALCRGGCKVVSAHSGDARAPDPECPRVVDHRRRVVRLPVVTGA